jgi:hypothetical protein
LGASAGICFWIGWLVSFWMEELAALFPTELMLITNPSEKSLAAVSAACHTRDGSAARDQSDLARRKNYRLILKISTIEGIVLEGGLLDSNHQ